MCNIQCAELTDFVAAAGFMINYFTFFFLKEQISSHLDKGFQESIQES